MTRKDKITAATYRLWGRWEHIGPGQFAVIVSAIPERQEDRNEVVLRLAESLEDARQVMRSLCVELERVVRAFGGVVVDVELRD